MKRVKQPGGGESAPTKDRYHFEVMPISAATGVPDTYRHLRLLAHAHGSGRALGHVTVPTGRPSSQSEQNFSAYKPLRFSTSLANSPVASAHVHEPKHVTLRLEGKTTTGVMSTLVHDWQSLAMCDMDLSLFSKHDAEHVVNIPLKFIPSGSAADAPNVISVQVSISSWPTTRMAELKSMAASILPGSIAPAITPPATPPRGPGAVGGPNLGQRSSSNEAREVISRGSPPMRHSVSELAAKEGGLSGTTTEAATATGVLPDVSPADTSASVPGMAMPPAKELHTTPVGSDIYTPTHTPMPGFLLTGEAAGTAAGVGLVSGAAASALGHGAHDAHGAQGVHGARGDVGQHDVSGVKVGTSSASGTVPSAVTAGTASRGDSTEAKAHRPTSPTRILAPLGAAVAAGAGAVASGLTSHPTPSHGNGGSLSGAAGAGTPTEPVVTSKPNGTSAHSHSGLVAAPDVGVHREPSGPLAPRPYPPGVSPPRSPARMGSGRSSSKGTSLPRTAQIAGNDHAHGVAPPPLQPSDSMQPLVAPAPGLPPAAPPAAMQSVAERLAQGAHGKGMVDVASDMITQPLATTVAVASNTASIAGDLAASVAAPMLGVAGAVLTSAGLGSLAASLPNLKGRTDSQAAASGTDGTTGRDVSVGGQTGVKDDGDQRSSWGSSYPAEGEQTGFSFAPASPRAPAAVSAPAAMPHGLKQAARALEAEPAPSTTAAAASTMAGAATAATAADAAVADSGISLSPRPSMFDRQAVAPQLSVGSDTGRALGLTEGSTVTGHSQGSEIQTPGQDSIVSQKHDRMSLPEVAAEVAAHPMTAVTTAAKAAVTNPIATAATAASVLVGSVVTVPAAITSMVAGTAANLLSDKSEAGVRQGVVDSEQAQRVPLTEAAPSTSDYFPAAGKAEKVQDMAGEMTVRDLSQTRQPLHQGPSSAGQTEKSEKHHSSLLGADGSTAAAGLLGAGAGTAGLAASTAGTVQGAGHTIVSTNTGIASGAVDAAASGIKGTAHAASAIAQAPVTVAQEGTKAVSGAASTLLQAPVEATRMAINTAADVGAAVLEAPTNLGEAYVKTVATGTGALARGVVELGRTAIKGATNLTADVVEAPVQANHALVKGLMDTASSVVKAPIQAAEAMIGGGAGAAATATGGAAAAAGALGHAIVDAGTSPMKATAEAAHDALRAPYRDRAPAGDTEVDEGGKNTGAGGVLGSLQSVTPSLGTTQEMLKAPVTALAGVAHAAKGPAKSAINLGGDLLKALALGSSAMLGLSLGMTVGVAAISLQLVSATLHGAGLLLYNITPTPLIRTAQQVTHALGDSGSKVIREITPATLLGALVALPGLLISSTLGLVGLASATKGHGPGVQLPSMGGHTRGMLREREHGGSALLGKVARWVQPELEDARIRRLLRHSDTTKRSVSRSLGHQDSLDPGMELMVDRYNRLLVGGGKGAASKARTLQAPDEISSSSSADSGHHGLLHGAVGAVTAIPAAAAGAAATVPALAMRGTDRVAGTVHGAIHYMGNMVEDVMGWTSKTIRAMAVPVAAATATAFSWAVMVATLLSAFSATALALSLVAFRMTCSALSSALSFTEAAVCTLLALWLVAAHVLWRTAQRVTMGVSGVVAVAASSGAGWMWGRAHRGASPAGAAYAALQLPAAARHLLLPSASGMLTRGRVGSVTPSSTSHAAGSGISVSTKAGQLALPMRAVHGLQGVGQAALTVPLAGVAAAAAVGDLCAWRARQLLAEGLLAFWSPMP